MRRWILVLVEVFRFCDKEITVGDRSAPILTKPLFS